MPSCCQCHGVREVNWKLKCVVPCTGKHQARQVHWKEFSLAVTMCSLWFLTIHWNHSGAGLLQCQTLTLQLNSRGDGQQRYTSEQRPLCTKSFRDLTENKEKACATMSKWMLHRKPLSRYFWSPDLEFASRALYSLHFIWCNISRVSSGLCHSKDCVSSSNHITALGMCIQLDIHRKPHVFCTITIFGRTAFPFFQFAFPFFFFIDNICIDICMWSC